MSPADNPPTALVTLSDRLQSVRIRRDVSVSSVRPPLVIPPSGLPSNVTSLARDLLTRDEFEITEKPVEELLNLVASGKLTAVEVTRAFLQRAALAHQLVNCLTELMPSVALERAEFLDRYYAQNKKPIGPLHGLPISTKEHLTMKGWEANFSFAARIGKMAATDGLLMRAVFDAGAIFYARTTQPQTLMHLETSSAIYGTTINPFNSSLTPGGSSGGESALIALRGSPLGIGSDTGGSIRVPAGHTGIYGLKPTSTRITLAGLEGIAGGRDQIPSVVGPMSTSIAGLEAFMKVVVGSKAWSLDPSIPPVEWRDQVDWLQKADGSRSIRIGVMRDDGVVTPHPPIQRAIRETVEKLSQHPDVEIVDMFPFDMELVQQIWATLLLADNGELMLGLLDESGEELEHLTTWILKEHAHLSKRSLEEIWDWTAKRDSYRADFARAWAESGGSGNKPMDVILCPLYPGAASPLGKSKYWNYSTIWNVLDYPSVSFPVTTVDQEVDTPDPAFKPLSEHDAVNHKLYDPKVYRDAPVSLQLVARRFEDEKLLQALRFILNKLNSSS